MAISRAFTTRRVKQSLLAAAEAENMPHRSNTTKDFARSIRNKISAPVELIHTTNMLSYNAPDIFPKNTSPTSSSSQRSDDDLSDTALTTASSPPTSPDVETPPPKRSLASEPNHLSCLFTPPSQAITPLRESEEEAPAIPQRALSHTKRSYDPIGRQRSNSRMSEQSHRTVSTKASLTFSRSSSGSTGTAATSHSSTPPTHKAKISAASFSSPPPSATLPPTPTSQPGLHRKEFSQSQHPFGPELAQVTEIAEEYGVKEKLNEMDAEEKEMIARGLHKFIASDYLAEIRGLESIFSDSDPIRPVPTTVWI